MEQNLKTKGHSFVDSIPGCENKATSAKIGLAWY